MRITVNVDSRSNIPVFQQSEYKFNITSRAVKNDVVGTVSAIDIDGVSITILQNCHLKEITFSM